MPRGVLVSQRKARSRPYCGEGVIHALEPRGLFMEVLLEVAAWVRCRVAVGEEVGAEVFLEAGELGVGVR